MLQKAMLKSMLDIHVMSPTNHGSISPANQHLKIIENQKFTVLLTILGIAMGGWLAREALIACRPRMKQCDTVKDLKVPTCKWSPLVRVCRSVQTWVSKQFRFATNMLDKRINSKTFKYVILGTKRTKKKVSAESKWIKRKMKATGFMQNNIRISRVLVLPRCRFQAQIADIATGGKLGDGRPSSFQPVLYEPQHCTRFFGKDLHEPSTKIHPRSQFLLSLWWC